MMFNKKDREVLDEIMSDLEAHEEGHVIWHQDRREVRYVRDVVLSGGRTFRIWRKVDPANRSAVGKGAWHAEEDTV